MFDTTHLDLKKHPSYFGSGAAAWKTGVIQDEGHSYSVCMPFCFTDDLIKIIMGYFHIYIVIYGVLPYLYGNFYNYIG